MSANKSRLPPEWNDIDLPEWTEEMFDAGEIRIDNKVVRPATGVLTKEGVRPIGRPPLGNAPKRQVTLRLDADMVERFRATGKGWQSRINDTLRKASGL